MRTIGLLLILAGGILVGLGQTRRPHGVALELGGKIGLIAGLTYEYRFADDRFGIGAGLGFANFERTKLVNNQPGGGSAGTRSELNLSTPLYGFASLGKGVHRLHVPLVLTGLHGVSRTRDNNGRTTAAYQGNLAVAAGAGYEYWGERWVFRATPYLGYLVAGDPGIVTGGFPWFGLTAGRRW